MSKPSGDVSHLPFRKRKKERERVTYSPACLFPPARATPCPVIVSVAAATAECGGGLSGGRKRMSHLATKFFKYT